MRAILFVSGALILCGCGSVGGMTVPASRPAVDHVAFRACVDREAPIVFSNAMKKEPNLALYGYHTDLYNEVISSCNPHLGFEGLSDTLSPSSADLAYVNAAVDAEVAVAMSQKEAEETVRSEKQQQVAEEHIRIKDENGNRAKNTYYGCLVKHAKTLARVSAEAADVIAQAALSSCPNERASLVEAMDAIVPSGGNEIAAGLDLNFTKSLLLEIVKVRALRGAPKPAQTKPATHTPI